MDKVESDATPIQHDLWNTLLQKHVNATGQVDYQGFLADSVDFQAYLALLSANHPNDAHWSREEQLAYWINAYNAFTIELVLKHYPVESIKDIKWGVPFINSVFDITFISIEGHTYDLNNIEQGIIRPYYKEPRIHFALNCASFSCPKLRNEAFTAERLEEQLDDQARAFINNPDKNTFHNQDHAEVSKILSWYSQDFDAYPSIIDFINIYAEKPLNPDASIDYRDYDWSLNEAK